MSLILRMMANAANHEASIAVNGRAPPTGLIHKTRLSCVALRDTSEQSTSGARPGDGTVVVRPSWRAYGKDIRKRAPFLVGMVPLILASFASATAMNRGHAPALLATLLGGILGLVLTFGAVSTLYYMLGRKLVATIHEVRVIRLFRKPAIVPVSSIHKIVRCTLTYSPGLSEPAVFGMDRTGHCVLSLYAGSWRWSDLERLWQLLGVHPEGSWDDKVPYDEVGSRFGVQA